MVFGNLGICCLCQSNILLCVSICLLLAPLRLHVEETNGFRCLQKIYQAPWPPCWIRTALQTCVELLSKNRLGLFNPVSVG